MKLKIEDDCLCIFQVSSTLKKNHSKLCWRHFTKIYSGYEMERMDERKFCPSTQRTGPLNAHQAGQTIKAEGSPLARHWHCSVHEVTLNAECSLHQTCSPQDPMWSWIFIHSKNILKYQNQPCIFFQGLFSEEKIPSTKCLNKNSVNTFACKFSYHCHFRKWKKIPKLF